MRVGAVDIGTNTVRLLVADVEGGAMVDLDRRSVVVGLGRGVDATGRLDDVAVRRTLGVLADFGSAIERLGVERRRAIATSASRDAADAAGFLDRVAALIGVTPDIVSGEDEAALSFRGAVWGLPGAGPSLVVDPGGGSTELVLGVDHPEHAVSVDIGSVRLTERRLPDRPASPGQVAAAREHVRDLLRDAPVAEAARVIGVGGTFTSLAAIDLALERHDRTVVHGSVMRLTTLDGLVDRLALLTMEETAAIPSLEPGRAPVLLAGAVVAAEAVRHTGHDQVVVTETDLLEGMVLGLAE